MLRDIEVATRTRANLFEAVTAIGLLPEELRHFTVINPPVDRTAADAWAAAARALETDPSVELPDA